MAIYAKIGGGVRNPLENENSITNCNDCQISKDNFSKYRKINKAYIPSMPFEYISSDILGPIDFSEGKKKCYILTITDHFYRYSKLIKINDIKSNTITSKFEKSLAKNLFKTAKSSD
ncbi:Transposon Ty2-DR3 Gag-Pol polyprotein [Dictyocoela muelleri]|nr:Transposon Ty2-DR3 Gag-Pol polyprotein [Dictyocoela muelleri]